MIPLKSNFINLSESVLSVDSDLLFVTNVWVKSLTYGGIKGWKHIQIDLNRCRDKPLSAELTSSPLVSLPNSRFDF